MKRTLSLLVLLLLALSACGPGGGTASEAVEDSLMVTDGAGEMIYTVADLEKLPVIEWAFKEVTYKGVSLPTLPTAAGFDARALRAVRVVAVDGYSVNYDPTVFRRQDVLVAYATVGGPLTEADGIYRTVLPGKEGRLNVRRLVELKVSP